MILALLLQVAAFQTYVDEARAKLGLEQPIRVEVFAERQTRPSGDVFAYTPHSPRNVVRVWDTALARASDDALKVVAYHEACHHFLRAQEKMARNQFQLDLVHALQRQCTVEALGGEFERILRRLRNGSYVSRLMTVRWWRSRCR